ncbi:alkaline phosphatase family protein [Ottowia sp. SB7-C50]|uniref:alkaline phosphatase family protein n=1 Tax=Ottowia sp. SB7-C50 TaxID=3081231 RepID=UPI002953EAAA|nr:alkaline phosphatase family protein [Ottowia sp. SB7-C50]WOP14541.1 alkaline phosphatase family protein [Ottowia sp. SB7-C50]
MTTRILRTRRLFGAFILGVLALAGCGHLGSDPASRADPAAMAATRPALVVMLVVDGLPMRQVTGYRHQLAPDGFARFLNRGAWYSDAHYAHAFTVTAAGHATLLTGAYPHRTGIIGNEWRDPVTGERVYNTADATAQYIGHKTQALDGTSPRRLKVESLGDVLKRADARSRVIAISGKDRGAILPAGWSGTAYMYMGETGEFASSTYYMAEHPAWVKAFNAAKPASRYFKTDWKLALAEAEYAHSLPDDQPWYGPKGGKLPMRFGADADAAPGAPYFASLLRSPFGDALALDFARAAIAGEQLGKDDAPDILSISLSGHDYVNHAFSAESRLSHDHLIQLDRLLQDFFRHLDETVGAGRYVAVLTADHGFSPAPEYSQQRGQGGGRLSSGDVQKKLEAGLSQRFGPGRWLLGISGSSLLIDKTAVAARAQDLDAVADEARRLLLAEPGVAAAYTRRELLTGSPAGAPFFEAMRRAWHRDVSGEVQFALQPGWMFGSTVATHGSPHVADTHVPILLYGPPWVQPGERAERVAPVDIAPTLARLLRVAAPAASEGRVLAGALR